MILKNVLCNYLHESANKIANDECGLTDQEVVDIAKCVMHIKINKVQAADNLNMSTRNFDRKIQYGELPEGRKNIGSNQLYWYLDELFES